MYFLLIKAYAYLREFIHSTFKIDIPGLGFLLRRVKKDTFLKVSEYKLFLNHKVADNYGNLVNGRFNEPETHLFLDYVFKILDNDRVHFVEVGGNIGEFLVSCAPYPQVKKMTIFEPQPEQAMALKMTIAENSFKNVTLVPCAVSNRPGKVTFDLGAKNSNGSGISESSETSITVDACTLDDTIQVTGLTEIFLIDVEGAELNVLEGANKIIKERKPLIIFEYNEVTRSHFQLECVVNYLGIGYEIYRLRRDGKLDKDFSRTWNLVAVPSTLPFQKLNNLVKV